MKPVPWSPAKAAVVAAAVAVDSAAVAVVVAAEIVAAAAAAEIVAVETVAATVVAAGTKSIFDFKKAARATGSFFLCPSGTAGRL